MVPSLTLAKALPRLAKFGCEQTWRAACRVDARFTLAFWTLASLTLALRTLVPSDTGCHRHWSRRRSSLSALDGARNRLDQPKPIELPPRRIVQVLLSVPLEEIWVSEADNSRIVGCLF